MADDPKPPKPPQPPTPADNPPASAPLAEAGASNLLPEPGTPPSPPIAAGDKSASSAPAEPLKAEVSRTDAPGAGASAAAAPKRPAPAVARPATPAAKPPAAAGGAEHVPKAAPPTGPSDPPPPADKTPPAFIATLQATLSGAVTGISYWVGDWTVLVAADQILDVAAHMRHAPDAAFDLCCDVTATDWPPRAERFDVVYCLYSTRHRHRVRVKTKVAEHQPFPSVTPVWPAANWLEREVWDMFGINFTGHPDRRRILMPEDWQGHPQRKDYPLEGPGELLMENPLDWLKLRQEREEADIE
jgi:NADH-quinone oxidoreductase subunit C